MEDARLLDAPPIDREEIERYIESHGGAIVLRCNGKIGSEAHAEFVAAKKANGYEDPPYDFVWIGDSTLGRDTSAADVDGAGSVTRSGHHESVGERQGRQPARVRFWRWLTRVASPSRSRRRAGSMMTTRSHACSTMPGRTVRATGRKGCHCPSASRTRGRSSVATTDQRSGTAQLSNVPFL